MPSYTQMSAGATYRRVSEGASLVKGDYISAGSIGEGIIVHEGHLFLLKPPAAHCANENHHEGEARGGGIQQHV